MDSGSGNKLPLAGRRVIVTRALHQATRLIAELERLGARVIHIPLIDIQPSLDLAMLDSHLAAIARYDWLAFTSTNGVENFLKRFDELHAHRTALRRLRVAAVGPTTRQLLEEQGIAVELESPASNAAGLASALIARYPSPEGLQGVRILLPTSNIGRDVIRQTLSEYGAIVDVIAVYRTEAPAISPDELKARLDAANASDIFFASPSAVTNLARILGTDELSVFLKGVRVVCLGEVTAQAAGRLGLKVCLQPQEATMDSIIEALNRNPTES